MPYYVGAQCPVAFTKQSEAQAFMERIASEYPGSRVCWKRLGRITSINPYARIGGYLSPGPGCVLATYLAEPIRTRGLTFNELSYGGARLAVAWLRGVVSDCQLWQLLSGNSGAFTGGEAAAVYRVLGMVPFAGYPLQARP